jgi:hypothetical protein
MEAREVTQKGVKSWMIEPPRYEGKRQRLFFPTEKEANAALEAYEKEVKRAGEFWARLGPAERISRVKLIYDNETTLNLMAATLENAKTKTYLAPMVLGFFGCMRPEEVTSDKPKRDGLPCSNSIRESIFPAHSVWMDFQRVGASGLILISIL